MCEICKDVIALAAVQIAANGSINEQKLEKAFGKTAPMTASVNESAVGNLSEFVLEILSSHAQVQHCNLKDTEE